MGRVFEEVITFKTSLIFNIMDNRGPAYVLIFGPAAGTLLSMLVKHLKNKGILIT